jgi:hypothetical protein
MINRLIKTVALVCPTQKVTSLRTCPPQTTITVLTQLKLTLDHAVEQQYARKSQGLLDKKINSDEIVHIPSRLTR